MYLTDSALFVLGGPEIAAMLVRLYSAMRWLWPAVEWATNIWGVSLSHAPEDWRETRELPAI